MSPEKLILGRYKVLERVGRGAMGVIYRGMDPVLDREVAIKVMSSDFAADGEESRKRFFREARAAAKLQHRNIVTVFEFAEEDGVPYIIMEFLRGRSLAAQNQLDESLPLERKLQIVSELCDGLQYASDNGIIHRDVKPANVWLMDDGTVKLVDFGIAKITTATSTLGKDVIGTAAYMSPEQAEGHPADGRSDIFSVGVVLYELVSGRRPFEAQTPTATLMKIVHEAPPPIASLVPDVPQVLVDVIGRALEKDPAARYQQAGELAAHLRLVRGALLGGTDLSSIETSLGSTTTRAGRAAVDPRSLTTRSTRPRSTGTRSRTRWWSLVAAGVIGGAAVTLVLYALNAGWIGGRAADRSDPSASPTRTPAPPAPPAAEIIRVTLDSKPSGAALTVDGKDMGKTPAVVDLADGTSHSLRFALNRYKTRDVVVTPDQLKAGVAPVELEVAEVPEVEVALASDEYDFAVLDQAGKPLRQAGSSHAFRIRIGQVVTVYAREYLLEKQIRIDRGGAYPMPKLGRLQVYFPSNCRASNKHWQASRGTPTEVFQAVEGTHLFEIRCDNGPVIRREGTVQPGLRTTVER